MLQRPAWPGRLPPSRLEETMDALQAITAFSQILGGIGLFFTGLGMLWLVTVYREKQP